MDNHLEPLRAPSITSQNAVIELFAEDAPPAKNCITTESASQDRQLYTPTTKQKVGGSAYILARNSSALPSAARTSSVGLS
jgi:hypothetical protein